MHAKFKEGYFTIKRTDTPNTSVAPDLGLEQTANRSKKNGGGVKGKTDDENFVTMWDLTHHEIVTVQNLCREVTFVCTVNEYEDHHELNEISTRNSEQMTSKIKDFILKKLNPFQKASETFRNIITEEICPSNNKDIILSIFNSGCQLYKKFYEERIYNKTFTLDKTINRYNLPKLSIPMEIPPELRKNRKGQTSDDVAFYKILELARHGEYDFKKLFTFQLSKKN